MTEKILALFSVPSLKSTVKLTTKDELGDYCLISWLGDKTNQMQGSHGNTVPQRFIDKARQALHNEHQM